MHTRSSSSSGPPAAAAARVVIATRNSVIGWPATSRWPQLIFSSRQYYIGL